MSIQYGLFLPRGLTHELAGIKDPLEAHEKLTRLARKVYRVLKIHGLGRIDVRVTVNGEIVIIEANPNPSLARDEDFAQSAAAAGVDYDQLIQRILDSALAP